MTLNPDRVVPTFVVVGHVNKGKSSVVATLVEDRTIPIDWVPGTTIEAGVSTFALEGEAVFRIIDTPGFQEAAAALAWMKSRAKSAVERRAAVEAFVEAHRDSPRFRDEVALLEPLLKEAGILYVVDVSRPFRDSHEAEMEILRWTGRPGIALLNRIGEADHTEEWKEVLQQYFSVVRSFDAHEVGFRERMGLLRAFAEVRDDWRAPLERAAAAMESDRHSRDQQTAVVLAEAIANALSHVERRSRVKLDAMVSEKLDDEMAEAFRHKLRAIESAARADVERIYRHHGLERAGDGLPSPLQEDLFHEEGWKLFGLTTRQLAIRGAAWGGVAGGALDLAFGGLSFGAGVLLGAIGGAAAAWVGSSRVAAHWTPDKARFAKLLPGEHGLYRCYGPVSNPRFAWVMADRALTHWRAVRERAHARQDVLHVDDSGEAKAGLAAKLNEERLRSLDRSFRRLARAARAGDPLPERLLPKLRSALLDAVGGA